MDDWVNILSNQGYITLPTHDITCVCCELKQLWDVYKCIMRSWDTKQNIWWDLTWSWISSARVLKNFIDMTNLSSAVVLLRTFPHIWISIPSSKNHGRVCQQQDGFILHGSFFIYLRINISQISQISTIRMKIRD